MRAVSRISLLVIRRRNVAERHVDGQRHDAEALVRQHHHRMQWRRRHWRTGAARYSVCPGYLKPAL